MLIVLLVAGNETATNLIGNGTRQFISDPEETARLWENRTLMPSAAPTRLPRPTFEAPARAPGGAH